MQRSTLAKRAALIFFLAAAAFYFYGLSHLPLIGPDEPRYAQVAREMYLRGDMVTPTLGGHTWFEKPALLYWMMMGSYRLFGVSDWAARLGPAICGLLTVIFIYWMGRRVERASDDGKMSGLERWSGVALASSVGLIIFTSGASFDILVTMTSTLALCCFFVSEIDEKRRHKFLAGFYAAVGASLLAKGLVGIVVPFGVIGLYYLLRRKWPGKTALMSLLWGVPLALAVASLWYAPVIARHGWIFIDEFFIQHHFARYVSNKYHHPQPFYFYLPVMLLLALPWVAFLIAGLARARRWSWRAEETVESKFRIFALAWLLAPVVFFSFSGSKLPGYVLPALPGAALLIGERLARFMQGEEGNVAMFFTGVILLLLALAGVVYAMQTNEIPITGALVAAVPLALGGILVIALKQKRVLRVELICGATILSLALALNFAFTQVARSESVRDLIKTAAARGYTSTPVFYMLAADRTAEFYAGGRLGYRPDGEPFRFDGANELADAARESGGLALVLIPDEWEKQLTDYSALQTEKLDSNGTLSLFVIRVR